MTTLAAAPSTSPSTVTPTSITRDLELEALVLAARWPRPAPRTILALAARLLAAHRDQAGFALFDELAAARPGPEGALLQVLAGVFQLRLAAQQPAASQHTPAHPERANGAVEGSPAASAPAVSAPALSARQAQLQDGLARLGAAASAPGLPTYFRGVTLAELPPQAGQAQAAVADLEWVLANAEHFPFGFRRGVYRGLARAYAALGRPADAQTALERSGSASLARDEPVITADYWFTARDGFHFASPRLLQVAPRVHAAQGYDFGDFAFVLTDAGIMAIDAGSTEEHARVALADLRAISDLPIRKVIVTHAHWDHIGGLAAFVGPETEVIAQANFAAELEVVNATGGALRSLFDGQDQPQHHFAPERVVAEPEQFVFGGTAFALFPVRGGETSDGLVVHLPDAGVVFSGDVLMPYLGAPFLPEGSAEGLFEAMQLIQDLAPKVVVHGHVGLTENFPIEIFPALQAALRELHARVLADIRDGLTQVEILHQNVLPGLLRDQPAAVLPYLVQRAARRCAGAQLGGSRPARLPGQPAASRRAPPDVAAAAGHPSTTQPVQVHRLLQLGRRRTPPGGGLVQAGRRRHRRSGGPPTEPPHIATRPPSTVRVVAVT